jgi:hypothetical protein
VVKYSGGNVDIIAISEIYGVSVGVLFCIGIADNNRLIIIRQIETERIVETIYFV